MATPPWLKTGPGADTPAVLPRRRTVWQRLSRNERFLDNTLRRVVSFVEDTMFNEGLSSRKGLLQRVEPRLKIVTLLSFVFALSLQRSMAGILLFSLLAVLTVPLSAIPLSLFIKRLLPAAVLTLLVSLPVVLNLMVEGDPLFILFSFERPLDTGPLLIPRDITVTRQGIVSAATLVLRVLTSVSFVFLLTMTTPPNTFVKALSCLVPGSLRSVVSISYRYIFFLTRKVEHFIMGLRSRQISAVKPSSGRHWVASRIGLLFSMSMEFSYELSMAMESRGYKTEGARVRGSGLALSDFSLTDVMWLIFSTLFTGVMVWKSLP